MKKIILAVLIGLGIGSIGYAAEPQGTVSVSNGSSYTPDPTTKKEGLNSWFNEASAGGGPIAYPGYMWGNAISPSSVQPGAPSSNVGYSAKVEQGVDWFAFDDDKKFRLNTFASALYARDTSNFAYTYGNVFTPAVGVKVRNVYESGLIEVGVQYVNQTNLNVGGSSGSGVQAFVNVWTGWDLKR
jgi:hypothetical protein